jgi:ribosomal-protein-alanine N-acetyltransferase
MTLTTLDTKRLRLSPLRTSDAQDLYPAMSDPVAMEHWHEGPPATIDEMRERVARMTTDGAHYWAIRLRESERCIGFVGFLSSQPPQGFGYFLHRDFWRRGLATEAARAALSFGFSKLGFRQAEAWIVEGNEASLALARRLKLQKVGALVARHPHRATPSKVEVYGLWSPEVPRGPHPDAESPSILAIVARLEVKDVARSVDFYARTLGFRVLFCAGEPPMFAGVAPSAWSGSHAQIYLARAAGERVAAIELTLLTADLDAVFARHEPLAMSPIETMPWGDREFTVRDPDGHTLRFVGR